RFSRRIGIASQQFPVEAQHLWRAGLSLPRGGSARSDLPCGIDDRVAEFRQEAPVVEVPPRVEIGPMVGGNGAPSTPQHPATPEHKAQAAPTRVKVLRRAGAGKNTV